jgi:hypothetical protein
MKDKLRELENEMTVVIECCKGTIAVAPEVFDVFINWRGKLRGILDAEGDGGAVGYVAPGNKIIFYVSEGWSREVPPGTDLYTHPARSGVVSDDDVRIACHTVFGDPTELDAKAMHAALEHFAKGERHER